MQRESESHEGESQNHREPAVEPAPAPRMEQPAAEPVRMEQPRFEEPRAEEPRIEQPRMEQPAQEPAPRVEAPRYEAPRIDAQEVLSSSGLQMVETSAARARPAVPEPEPVQLGRPRREKPAVPAVAETELVQVETRDK